jgi:hypothetical protein
MAKESEKNQAQHEKLEASRELKGAIALRETDNIKNELDKIKKEKGEAFSLNDIICFGEPIICHAAKFGSEVVAFLIEYSKGGSLSSQIDKRILDLNVKKSYGETPLMYAVQKNHYHLAKLLLTEGADPDAEENGQTALHIAAENGNQDIANLLLDFNANPNPIYLDDPSEECANLIPAHYASLRGDLPMFKLLSERGADLTRELRVERGDKPYNVTIQKIWEKKKGAKEAQEIIEHFMKKKDESFSTASSSVSSNGQETFPKESQRLTYAQVAAGLSKKQPAMHSNGHLSSSSSSSISSNGNGHHPEAHSSSFTKMVLDKQTNGVHKGKS